MEEDKRVNPKERKGRLVAGGISTVPIAIVVAFLYQKVFKETMDHNVAIALASILGSMGTGFVLCFKDMRSIFCGYLIRKRIVRNRRKL